MRRDLLITIGVITLVALGLFLPSELFEVFPKGLREFIGFILFYFILRWFIKDVVKEAIEETKR